ncbi:hypothetical protein [Burkholderia pseudomallei]|uniref:hypothetical protein n=1 Tax=Burkholderia pseudomallei TaxID=28450 RepID=UPI00155FE533
MNVRTRKVLSPHDRLALIDLESISLTKRCVRDDKGCVFTIGVVAHSLGVDEEQVRTFTDKRSEHYVPEFPVSDGVFRYDGVVRQYWLARNILTYCQSLMNGVSVVQAKSDSDVRRRSEKGGAVMIGM